MLYSSASRGRGSQRGVEGEGVCVRVRARVWLGCCVCGFVVSVSASGHIGVG